MKTDLRTDGGFGEKRDVPSGMERSKKTVFRIRCVSPFAQGLLSKNSSFNRRDIECGVVITGLQPLSDSGEVQIALLQMKLGRTILIRQQNGVTLKADLVFTKSRPDFRAPKPAGARGYLEYHLQHGFLPKPVCKPYSIPYCYVHLHLAEQEYHFLYFSTGLFKNFPGYFCYASN